MGEVRVVGIRVEQPQNQPVLLLREANGDRYLPIWIGQSEAAAIALEQQGVEPPRPLTHDLIRDLIAALGHSLKEVRIVDLQEGTFYADLIFDRDIKVSARPSDSVAIALRVGRTTRAGTPWAVSRWATDSRQVTATAVSPRRQRRSWNAASVAALAGSSRTCRLLAERPISANASATSARVSTSTLSLDRSAPPWRAARNKAAYK